MENPAGTFHKLWNQLKMDNALAEDKFEIFPRQKKLRIQNYESMKRNLNKIKDISKFYETENLKSTQSERTRNYNDSKSQL